MTGGMLAFLDNPAEWEKLRQNPALLEGGPSRRWYAGRRPSFSSPDRHPRLPAARQTIAAGQSVCCSTRPRTADEEVFEDPFGPHRPPSETRTSALRHG